MNFLEALNSGVRQTFSWAGRSSRSEFIYWVLGTAIYSFVLIHIAGFVANRAASPDDILKLEGLLIAYFGLGFLFFPTLALIIRRLHDTNRGWFWIVLVFIPWEGPLFLFGLCCLKGSKGPNRFGQNPLGLSELNQPRIMDFPTAIQSCFVNCARFSGRASRSEYWWGNLFLCLFLGTAKALDRTLLTHTAPMMETLGWLVVILPYFSLAVRRWHDLNRSGWWLLVDLIPLIGPLSLVVVNCLKGTTGPNRYGPDPLAKAPQLV